MKGIIYVLGLFVLVVGVVFSTNAGDDFVAADSSFKGYENWAQIDYTVYPVNHEILGNAHMGADSNYVRLVYQNVAPEDGVYPVGAMIVKETFKWDDGKKVYAERGGLLAMAKRGSDFNVDANGWEWFMLKPDGSVAGRGGEEMMDGMCNGCHSAAETDLVFAHPSEYILPEGEEIAMFENADAKLPLWDENVGEDDFLGKAHGVKNRYIRSVFKWQPGAIAANGEYPVGTIIVKRLTNHVTGKIPAVGGGVTAMVKRGGDFNPENGNWEWFMRTPDGKYKRGANLMDGMCNGCHASATGEDGTDYVFNHDK